MHPRLYRGLEYLRNPSFTTRCVVLSQPEELCLIEPETRSGLIQKAQVCDHICLLFQHYCLTASSDQAILTPYNSTHCTVNI